MKKFALLFIGLASFALAADAVKISYLVASPDKFDKKVVKTSGIIAKFKAKTSKAGNDYMTFDLKEGEHKVEVYSHGKMDLKNGDKVSVEGKFLKEKTLFKGKDNEFTVKNEIDASGKKGESPLIKKLQ